MAAYLKIGVAVGGLVLVPLACGTEFHACAGAECDTTTGGGSAGTSGAGGTTGGTAGGSITTDAGGATGQGGTATTGGTAGGGEGGDPGVGGSAGAGGSPPECDGELLPVDDACVVAEEYGVFVSPGGDDASGDGTREAPFATLDKAADAASKTGKRVYACATGGDYVSALTLTEEHDGLELYGSFDCSDWSYDGELRAKVAPDAGVALSVSAIETSLELEGFTFESADAITPGGSSIAAEIHVSSGVVLRRVALRAGAGAAGAPGVTVDFTYPEKSALDGVPGTEDGPGVMPFVTCPAGDTTRGGPGGSTAPADGSSGTPNHEGLGGEGGVVGADCSSGIGKAGADGPAGSDGAGAMTVGALDNGSWVPASGADAGHGLPGQGGGGGAGAANGGGGSGGAGGCGGAGGKAGGGGGASIALLLVDAEVALLDSEVTAGDAGDGGAGSSGQAGQQESGSFGAGEPDGCPGGRGGLGGNGGNAGGGAGGISVGVLVQGTAPALTNTDVTVGTEGLAGEGAGESNDGVPGLAQPELGLAGI